MIDQDLIESDRIIEEHIEEIDRYENKIKNRRFINRDHYHYDDIQLDKAAARKLRPT